VADDPQSKPLGYRSGQDAAGDDERSLRRSLRTWLMLLAVWAVGLCVWGVYLAAIGYLAIRFLA
jgi:hypothetical protein